MIDFTRSLPPVPDLLHGVLQRALSGISGHEHLERLVRNTAAGGTEDDRLAGAAWLKPRYGAAIDPRRVVLTNGTQSAMLLLFQYLVRPKQVLLAERLSYGALRDVARIAGVQLVGVEFDEGGVIPEAVSEACQTHEVGALFCNPTFHNPTTSVMSGARRLALAQIARQRGIAIIEDDPIGRLYAGLPPPISAVAPDVVWYASGLTKCITHGARVAYIVAPDAPAAEALVSAVYRLSNWVAAPISAALVGWMVRTGAGEEIAKAIADENLAREALACKLLANHSIRTHRGTPHIWMPLGQELTHDRAVTELERAGVLVRPATMFAVDGQPPPQGIRLSLSSPLLRTDVHRGLEIVAQKLSECRAGAA